MIIIIINKLWQEHCHAHGLFMCVYLPMCSLWPNSSLLSTVHLIQVCPINSLVWFISVVSSWIPHLASYVFWFPVFVLQIIIKDCSLEVYPTSTCSSSPASCCSSKRDRTPDWNNFICIVPLHLYFLCFVQCFVFCFPHVPNGSPCRKVYHPRLQEPFPVGVCGWVQPALHFNVIQRYYYRPVDLSDTTGLSWIEVIIWCLEMSLAIQNTARPNAQPTISPLRGAQTQTHPCPTNHRHKPP